MANTTNFGWETPDDTDLVKDGASAMRTLGNAIDTSLVDLKGGTTGQVLSKASNTDMDFTWVAQDDSNAIQNAIVDAKGDLISATAADTPARLAVGTDGQVLAANSSTSTGLEWQTISAGGMTSLASGSLAASVTGFDIQNISQDYNELWLYVRNYSVAAGAKMYLQTNNNSGNDYTQVGLYLDNGSYSWGNWGATFARLNYTDVNTTQTGQSAIIKFRDYKNTTNWKIFESIATESDTVFSVFTHYTRSTSAINRIKLYLSTSSFDAGTYELFGVK